MGKLLLIEKGEERAMDDAELYAVVRSIRDGCWVYECRRCGTRIRQDIKGNGTDALLDHAEAHDKAVRP